MKIIIDYIEAASKIDRKDECGFFIAIEDIFRYFKYDELECLFHVITKFGGDSYSENKILDWYTENRE
ncbi:MAG: hypothetical protein ACI35P_12240 [Bacillus sp. (in: firmicutes)]